MLMASIVVWIVLLLLALNVAAFVTRIIEKYRLAHRLSKFTERTVSIAQISEPATFDVCVGMIYRRYIDGFRARRPEPA